TEQLIKNNSTLLKLENVAKIGTWEVDLLLDKVTWSEQTRRIYQVSSSYQPDLESAIEFFRAGKSRDSITNAVQTAIESGNKWDLELQLITANNQNIWVSTFGEAEFV
ncbi:hypothetical protein, partial [Enterococcus faecium]